MCKICASTHVSCSALTSTLARFLSGTDRFSVFMSLLSRACLHRSSLVLFSSSLQTRIAATLRSLLNSCTGLRNASLLDGSSMWDVFSVWSVKPSGTVIEFCEWLAMCLVYLKVPLQRTIRRRKFHARPRSSCHKAETENTENGMVKGVALRNSTSK
jgi:hypothetical protein